MNLLKADIFHYIKDRTTYVLLAIVFIMPLFYLLDVRYVRRYGER